MKQLNKEAFEKTLNNSNDTTEAKPRKCCTVSVPLRKKKKKERPVEF